MLKCLTFVFLIGMIPPALTCIGNIIDDLNVKHILYIHDNNTTNSTIDFSRKTWSIYTIGTEIPHNINIRMYDLYLFQLHIVNLKLIKTTLRKIFVAPQFKFKCFVMVKLTGNTNLAEIFKIFWSFYVLSILIIDQDLRVYTYFPLSLGNCAKIKESYLFTCYENAIYHFDRPEKFDFTGCPIRVYLRTMPPFVQQGGFNNNTGFIIKIFRTIFEHLKLTPVTIPHNVTSGVITLPNGGVVNLMSKMPNGSYVGLAKNAMEGGCDILFISLGLNSAVDDFDYTYPLDFTKIRFYVPIARPLDPWKNIFKVFSLNVWIGILIILIIFTPIWYLVSRKESETTLEYSFFLLINTLVSSSDYTPTMDLIKIIYLTWIIFTFMLINFYQSLLLSFIFQPNYEPQITTIEQLSESRLAIKSVKALTQILAHFENCKFAKVAKKIENVESLVPDAWRQILENGEIAVFSADSVASVAASAYKQHKAFALDGGFSDQTIVFIAKGSPFTSSINAVIKRLHENGLMARWMPPSVKGHVAHKEGQAAISLKHFISALAIYVCGIAFSFLIFCVELVYGNCRVVLPTNNL